MPVNPKPIGTACVPRPSALNPKVVRGFAPLFKALGDETRLEMVALLAAAGGPLCVCDFETRFDLGQPTVSHHLKVLREAGLVTALRKGSWVHYALCDEVVGRIAAFHSLMTPKSSTVPVAPGASHPSHDAPVRIRVAR